MLEQYVLPLHRQEEAALPLAPARSRVLVGDLDLADSDEDDWLPRHLRDTPPATSTPTQGHHPRRRRATMSAVPGAGRHLYLADVLKDRHHPQADALKDAPRQHRHHHQADVLRDVPRHHRHHHHQADVLKEMPRHHRHHRRLEEDLAVDAVPRLPKRTQMNVPYSTLQAMLFRCTAARNGCLSSKNAYSDVYPVRRMGRSWSVHNATANRAATL